MNKSLSNTPPTIQSCSGFTLIELLIALSLLAIITTTLFILFTSMLNTTSHARKHMTTNQTARAIFAILQDDMRYMLPTTATAFYKFSTTPKQNFPAEKSLVSFATTNSLTYSTHTPKRSQQYVHYTVKKQQDKYNLIRYERPSPTVQGDFPPVRYVLADNLTTCSFEYYDNNYNIFQHDWNQKKLPAAIRISLSLGTEAEPSQYQLIIPLPQKEEL